MRELDFINYFLFDYRRTVLNFQEKQKDLVAHNLKLQEYKKCFNKVDIFSIII
jgi:pantothenate kinase-related protein Tda10